jgi:hypothetical protein
MERTVSTAFVPGWRTAGEDTRDPSIGSGRLKGEFDETALRIVLEFAEDTDGGVDRWIFQLPGDIGLNLWEWNPNGEVRAFDAADNNKLYRGLAMLDRMGGALICITNEDTKEWSAEYPFTFTAGCSAYILFVPRGQAIPNIIGE